VIRELLARARRIDWRRVAALVALLAFALVVALSTAHTHDGGASSHEGDCGVCSAIAAIGTSESFAAPQLVDCVRFESSATPRVADVLPDVVLTRAHAPRGPPAPTS